MINKSFDELQTGMVVGEDVTDSYGYIIVERGTVLNATHLVLLQEKGISHVPIEENPPTKNQQFLKRELHEIENRINKKFEPHKKNPIMQHIASMAKQYLQTHARQRYV